MVLAIPNERPVFVFSQPEVCLSKKYNAERIAAALNGQFSGGPATTYTNSDVDFGQPELLAELGFDKLKFELQMATIIWVEKTKACFVECHLSKYLNFHRHNCPPQRP